MRKAFYSLSLIVLSNIESVSSFAEYSNAPEWMHVAEKQNHLGVIAGNVIAVIAFLGLIIGFVGGFWGLLEMKEMIPGDPDNGPKK